MGSISMVRDTIAKFVEKIANRLGLNVPQKKHMAEYILGLMLPSDNKRKSVNAINDLVGRKDQSSLNRFLNNMSPEEINEQWMLHLKEEIEGGEVYLIIDDTLLEHEDAEKMGGVGAFFDHTREINVFAHQFVTSVLVTVDTNEIVPFTIIPYLKIGEFLGECKCKQCKQIPHRFTQLGVNDCSCKGCNVGNFKTKTQIAKEICEVAYKNFNVKARVFDSWYLSKETTEGEGMYLSEMKSTRWVNPNEVPVKFADLHSGRHRTNVVYKAGWRKVDEYAKRRQLALLDRTDNQRILCRFTKYYQSLVYLHSGERVALFALFDPVKKEFKYLVTNKLDATIEDVLCLWRIRWFIEEFHKDAKDLGLGEYQLRKLTAALIHARLLQMAYSLLKRLASMGTLIFAKSIDTIGECSRELKGLLFYKSRKRLSRVYV